MDTLQDTEKSEETAGVQEENKIDTKEEEVSGEDEESEYETDEESEYETEDSGGEDGEPAKAKDSNPSEDVLADLTPCDVRVLVHSEEELTQCETFERIFPTSETGCYLKYMDTNYYDLLLLAWERCQGGGDRQRGRDRLALLTSKVPKHIFLELDPDANNNRVFTLRCLLQRSELHAHRPKME